MRLAAVASICLPLFAQIPAEDSRNIAIPGPGTHFTMPHYASRREWSGRRVQLRSQILSAAGLVPMPPKTPLHPQVIRTLDRGDYAIETVLLETLPGYYLGGNLYRPLHRSDKLPAVLIPHGHWKRGRLEDKPSYSVPALGINLARQGYVVFAWDMVGYNDTRQTSHSFDGWREQLWSFNPLGLQLWNSIRSIDYLQSLDEVDGRRIAATGASGGGTQTFLLSAVDNRVRYSAPVNMISAHAQGADPCEEAPGLRLDTFNVEIAALMAPRPMLMLSCTGDWTRNTPKEEFPEIRRIYELFGRPDNVANLHEEADHNYNRQSRESVYQFLAGHMLSKLDPEKLWDRDIQPERDADMLAFQNGARPHNYLDYDRLFAEWRAAAEWQILQVRDIGALRAQMRHTLAVEWPRRVWTHVEGESILLSRAGKNDRVPGLWIKGKGVPVLVVHPEGSHAARDLPLVRQLIRAGRPILMIDAFQTGAAKARRDVLGKYFLSYNRTDDANRVQDILTGMGFLDAQYRGKLQLAGFDRAAVWCLFAASVGTTQVELITGWNGFRGTDEEFRDKFFVPGIQRAGGLTAALRLVKQPHANPTPNVSESLTDVTSGSWIRSRDRRGAVLIHP